MIAAFSSAVIVFPFSLVLSGRDTTIDPRTPPSAVVAAPANSRQLVALPGVGRESKPPLLLLARSGGRWSGCCAPSAALRVARLTPGVARLRERASYQSAWTTVPLCSVTIVALANHAGAAEDISGQFSVASCQCLAMPAGDS